MVTHHPTADTTVIHTPPPIIPTTMPHHHQQLVRTADTTTQTLAVAGKLIISQNRKFQGGLARNLKRTIPSPTARDMHALAFFVEVNTGTDGRTLTVKNH